MSGTIRERLMFWKKNPQHSQAAAQVGQMISSFNIGDVKSMASGLRALAKDVETEYQDFSEIADSLTKFSEAASEVREQITIIRFLANLAYIDAGALSTLESKVDELEKLVEQSLNLQQSTPIVMRNARKKAVEVENIFTSFEAKRAYFINAAPKSIVKIKEKLAGAEKINVSTSLGYGGGNGKLNEFLRDVAKHLKSSGAHTSADLTVLNEQIMKLDTLLDGTVEHIQNVESKGINMKAVRKSMSNTTDNLMALTGSILAHAQKHEEIFRKYSTVSKNYETTSTHTKELMFGTPNTGGNP